MRRLFNGRTFRIAVSCAVVLLTTFGLAPLSRTRWALAGKFNAKLSLGDQAPTWSDLPGIDGKSYSLDDFVEHKLIVLAFQCNHCPITEACDARLKELADEFADREVQVIVIGCSLRKGEDLAAMKERAAKAGFEFPCLRDDSQAAGKAYGVTRTPSYFVLDGDRKIAYMGAIDDRPEDAKHVKRSYLKEAIKALLAGGSPRQGETKVTKGCELDYETLSSP